MPAKPQLKFLAPTQIRANEENPRLHFPPGSLDTLAASISDSGVLVPVSVFRKPRRGKPPYVLIDGERRWRCASDIGLAQIPAIVLPPPDTVENLKTMFNIHMLRDPWDDMPTAWALQKLIERTKESDLNELSQMTGVSLERLRRFKLANELPKRYQRYIDSGDIPMNFFYELDKNLIRPLGEKRPAVFAKYGTKRILDAFVHKYLTDVITDTVSLRRIAPIISEAARQSDGRNRRTQADAVIERLIEVPEATVQDAYEETVGLSVESDKFAKQCELLVLRLERLLDQAADASEQQVISTIVRRLVRRLEGHLKERAS